MTLLNKTEFQLQARRGTASNIKLIPANVTGIIAEIAYTTDTNNLFIHDGSNFIPVSIGSIVFSDNEIISYENETVWSW